MTSSDGRLYAGAIALVSGVYSIAAAGSALGQRPMGIGVGGWVMLVVGAVVVVHGIALLTPIADRIGRSSGPLMIAWAAIMLGNQLLSVAVPAWSMSTMDAMAWDGGMVAVAVLMLASGLIMSRRGPMP